MTARTLALAALLASLAFAAPGALGSATPARCTTNGGDITLEVEPLVSLSGTDQRCGEIPSGGKVEWRVATLPQNGVRHDPGDVRQSGKCFRTSLDTGDALDSGEVYGIRLRYDGERLWRETPAGLRPCSAALDPQTSDADVAVVDFKCWLHPGWTGVVRVQAT